MQENNPNNLKSFFIKLISITIAIIIVFNVVFNLIFAQRLEKIDKIFSIFETQERKNIKNKIISELEKGLEKEEIINKEDKIIILKTYNKIKKEFKNLDTN
tara:strand:- start:3061 stop:3363 length:303 start_codon:yes stop_codon:yes gene_type:complete